MANGWSLFIGLAVIIILGVVGYLFSPKGENQTIWRSSILLTLACTYLMWALTFLAQLNPLITPQAADFRKGYIE